MFSFTKILNALQEVFGVSDITPADLQHEQLGPRIIKRYRNLAIEKRQIDGVYMISMAYAHSQLRDFEKYLRIVVGVDDDDIQLILKQCMSIFTTYETLFGIYSTKDNSEVLPRSFKKGFEMKGQVRPNVKNDKSDSVTIECYNITMRTKLIVRHDTMAMSFGQQSFFRPILGFSPDWVYKSYDEYVSEKVIISSTTLKYNSFKK